MKQNRLYRFDNIKAVLIFCVVAGHLLESVNTGILKYIYVMIYLFHMPLFAFCSGYFAAFRPDRIVKKMLVPYLVFQVIYCFVVKPGSIQFTTPVWSLWYLPALAVWTITLPFLETKGKKTQLLILAASTALGLLCGLDETVGYYLSLARILVYYPFFLGGHLVRQSCKEHFSSWISGLKREIRWGIVVLAAAAGYYVYLCYPQIKIIWLYGTYSYGSGGYALHYRLIFYGLAVIISAGLLVLTPDRRTWFTVIGQRSLSVYLLHAPLICLIQRTEVIAAVPSVTGKLAVVILLAFGIVRLCAFDWKGMDFREKYTYGNELDKSG